MATFEKLTAKNLDIALAVCAAIFPKIDLREDLADGMKRPPYYKDIVYWLVKDKGVYIGIIGLYCYTRDARYKSAWVGWFGILKALRGQGYAGKAFEFFESQAKRKGYKNVRVYTDKSAYKSAAKFYEKREMVCEAYLRKRGVVIFSKSLSGRKVMAWNNKDLRITE